MAEQVLEQVLLILNAKVDGFEKAMKEASQATKDAAKQMTDASKGMTGGIESASVSFTDFKNKVLAVAGAGGLALLIKSTFDAADELGRLSQTTGFSTDSIQKLKFAASQLNVEEGTLTAGMTIFNKTIGEAVTGNDAAKVSFGALGVALKDNQGNLKTSETLFKEVSTAISHSGNAAEQAAIATALFGRSGAQLLPILSGGAAGIAEFEKKALELGLVIDKSLIEKADETNDKLHVMQQVINAELAKALIDLAPTIQFAAEQIAVMAGSAGYLVAQSKDLWSALTDMYGGMRGGAKDNSLANDFLEEFIMTEGKATDAIKKTNFQFAERKRVQEEAQKLATEQTQGGTDQGDKLAKEIEILKSAEAMKLEIKGGTANAIMAKESELFIFNQEQGAKQIDELLKKNADMRALNDTSYAEDIEANQARIDQMLYSNQIASSKFLDIKAKERAITKTADTKLAADRMTVLNNVANLQHSKIKELAVIGKAAAIVQATISTYQGAALALSVIPFPFGFVAAGLTVAAGLAQVASIAGIGTEFKTGADMIPGLSLQDTVSAVLQPGERVVKTDTNKVLEQFLQDYRNGDSGPSGGAVSIELKMSDNFMDMIETNLVSRGRVQVSNLAA